MAAPSRTLVVMRHAKAEQDGPTDAERPLAERGHADAEATGAWLAERGLAPDHALVSAARRTQETWASVASGAAWRLAPELDAGLYSAGVDTALDLLRLLDRGVSTAVLVGHNPTMASLAQLLDDGSADPAVSNEMALGFPTSALAIFEVSVPWADLAFGSARLSAYHVTRR